MRRNESPRTPRMKKSLNGSVNENLNRQKRVTSIMRLARAEIA